MGQGSVPGQGTKISQAAQHGQNQACSKQESNLLPLFPNYKEWWRRVWEKQKRRSQGTSLLKSSCVSAKHLRVLVNKEGKLPAYETERGGTDRGSRKRKEEGVWRKRWPGINPRKQVGQRTAKNCITLHSKTVSVLQKKSSNLHSTWKREVGNFSIMETQWGNFSPVLPGAAQRATQGAQPHRCGCRGKAPHLQAPGPPEESKNTDYNFVGIFILVLIENFILIMKLLHSCLKS